MFTQFPSFDSLPSKIIRSLYRDSEAQQFELEVLGESIELGEEFWLVRLLPPYQDKFQEGDSITKLRKSMVDGAELYKYQEYNDVKFVQLSLF